MLYASINLALSAFYSLRQANYSLIPNTMDPKDVDISLPAANNNVLQEQRILAHRSV